MSDKTGIEWTDATWNPVLGCDRVSPGCDSCYAITNARIRESNPNPKVAGAYSGLVEVRDGRVDWTGHVKLLDDRLDQPFRWAKPRRIFVNAQSDLFHDGLSDQQIARVFAAMMLNPRHTFQILTKRHGRMRSLLNDPTFRNWVAYEAGALTLTDNGPRRNVDFSLVDVWPLPNVWLGVSAEDQRWADIRIPALLQTPAAIRFVSAEPLLGPIAFADAWLMDQAGPTLTRLDWVIVGGESGRGARPMSLDWIRTIRDDCVAAEVAFHFKQWGDASKWTDNQGDVWTLGADGLMHTVETTPLPREYVERKWGPLKPVGKKAAGRELDGQNWDEFPDQVTV